MVIYYEKSIMWIEGTATNLPFLRYCECFAAGDYCDGCNCKQCGNTVDNEKGRQDAINNTKLRNPNAFQPKIENGPIPPSVRKVHPLDWWNGLAVLLFLYHNSS